MNVMTGYQIFRFCCITVLWLFVCYLLVASQPMSARVVLVIIASAIIVFVPLYKRYIKNNQNEQHKGSKAKRKNP